MTTVALVGQACSYVALSFGIFFFFFACKYYFAILIALFSGGNQRKNGNGNTQTRGFLGKYQNGRLHEVTLNDKCVEYDWNEPFVSIHLPFYNEKNVAKRVIQACLDIDYTNYEVIVADDSRDETIEILKKLNKEGEKSTIKYVHRKDRTGFKGGALQKAVSFMNPNTKYVVIFDADFIPPPDILKRFLWYFESQFIDVNKNENSDGHKLEEQSLNYSENGIQNSDIKNIYDRVDDWFERRRIGVVQGYQLHHLNKNENWITKGIRAEFSGGYMIERVAEEYFGSMKMITGSVFMIRADILKKLGWTNSITEDWDLTLRMYLEGYKVLYTPLIQASAEIPTTIRALARQRMRWAEGHTFAVKKYFWDILRSRNITAREKMEFIYFSPYYLQSFFFLIGTFFWVIAELLGQHPFFWTATFGWCLILSNLFSLPLMSLSGLYLEQTARQDYAGIFSFIVLSYVLTPFQAYAAVKGLLEKDEGGWVRTLKTGSITDRVLQVKVRRLFSWILPRRESISRARSDSEHRSSRAQRKPSAFALILLVLMSSLIVWVAATAMSISVSEYENTFLSLEYIFPAVTIHGKTTRRILTHPDFTSLKQLQIDSFTLSSKGWQKAWEFYLYEPLEKKYKMKGDLDVYLFLYSDQERESDIKIIITDLDERGENHSSISYQFNNVNIGDESPERPLVLSALANKLINFKEGHSIIIEILFKGEIGASYYLEYDSQDKNSKVDFPGVVMPESIMPVLLIAPVIPIAVLKLRKRRVRIVDITTCARVRGER